MTLDEFKLTHYDHHSTIALFLALDLRILFSIEVNINSIVELCGLGSEKETMCFYCEGECQTQCGFSSYWLI